MREKILESKLDGFILAFAFVLANLRALMFVYLYPDTSILLGPAWIEIFLWLLIMALAVFSLALNNTMHPYLLKWRRNGLLGLFVFLALLSVLWSIGGQVTLFRGLELLSATLIGSYIGFRYRPHQILEFLFWFGALLLIFCMAIVYVAPKTGTMYWAPFDGAWRGIYWHRNHLASVTALLNIVFLSRAVIASEQRNKAGILDGLFYVISLVVLYFAKSAAGFIVSIVLHLIVFCIWVWLKISHRLQRLHYSVISGIFVLGSILLLSNLDSILGLFNRDTTLTGRVGLWTYLLREVVLQRPWLGHGFGAVWTIDSFREQVRQQIGWSSQPLIGDNGFLDILLHLGAIGLLIFIGILILACIRALRYGIEHKTLSDFFPLLVLLYAVLANISFSLFAETEVFVWFLIVAVLFMVTASPGRSPSD